MAEVENTRPDTGDLMRKIHERPQMPLAEWLRAPSHVHYKAFRMSDPPVQRPASREEFRSLLEAFKVPSAAMAIRDDFGYGVKVDATGDRIIMIWEAHTEYYSHHTWHVPSGRAEKMTFGPLTFPQSRPLITPLGAGVCRLNILLMPEPLPASDVIRPQLPGPVRSEERRVG